MLNDGLVFFLTDVLPTSDPIAAFKNVDAAILVGAMPRKEGMERKDLLKANVKIFKAQGEALDQHAKKTVKVNWLCLTLSDALLTADVSSPLHRIQARYGPPQFLPQSLQTFAF